MRKNILRLLIILLVITVLVVIVFFMKSNNLINIFNIGFKNKQNEETLTMLNEEKNTYSQANSGTETVQGFCDYLLEKQIVANEEITENNGVKQIVVGSYIFNVNQVDDSTIEIIDTGEQLSYITYENFKRKNQTTGSATVVIEDDSEIEKIECPAIGESKAIIINANGSKKVSKDYQNIILNKVYIFKITTVSGEVKEKRFKAVSTIENVIYTASDFQTAYSNAVSGDTLYISGKIAVDFDMKNDGITIVGADETAELFTNTNMLVTDANNNFENIKFTGPSISCNVSYKTINFKNCSFDFTGYFFGDGSGFVANSYIYGLNMYFDNCKFESSASRNFGSFAYESPKAYIKTNCTPHEISQFSYYNFRERWTLISVPVETETIKAYSIGDEVTVDGESFYVIEESDATKEDVTLIAEKCIDTSTNEQSDSAQPVAFSSANYWSAVTTYPLNLNDYSEYKEGDVIRYAIESAKAYGEDKGGEGRLLTKEEADSLIVAGKTDLLYGKVTKLSYWLGSSLGDGLVWCVWGEGGRISYGYFYEDYNAWVRPVINISKSKIS